MTTQQIAKLQVNTMKRIMEKNEKSYITNMAAYI